MSYTPPRERLRGLSLQSAELYGKPGWNAFYANGSVKSHKAIEPATCMCCGRPATNVHHVSPLSRGKSFRLVTPNGKWILKPALFALCGSGTTGCHNGFHGGARFRAEWVWRDDEYARAWWDGQLLRFMEPHSQRLYLYGSWRIHDAVSGSYREVSAYAL